MKRARAALVDLIIAGSMMLACSTNDTIVSVNVSATKDVGEISNLHLIITPQNGSPVVRDLAPKNTSEDAGTDEAGTALPPIKYMTAPIFERITIPEGVEGPATVDGELSSASGLALLKPKATVQIQIEDGKATAAYLDFTRTPPATGGSGNGSGGAAAEGGAGGESAGAGGAEG